MSTNQEYREKEYRIEFSVNKSSQDSYSSGYEWSKGFGRDKDHAIQWFKKLICNSRNYIMRDDQKQIIGPDLDRINILSAIEVK